MRKILIKLLLTTLSFACVSQKAGDVSVHTLKAINFSITQDSILLDVRTLKEFDTGKIATSKNIDVTKTDDFTAQVKKLDKSKHYFIVCRSGNRSRKAIVLMQDLGFQNLYNISGGILAWENENFPLER